MSDGQLTDLYVNPHFIGDPSALGIFTRPPLGAGPVQSEIFTGIFTGIFIHISVFLITKLKILINTKSGKLINL